MEAKKVMELEQRLSLTADAVSVATPAEQKALLEIAPTTRMPFWFSNGVDVEYFKPIPVSIIRAQLCFVGRMDYLPNVDCVEWFVSSCWEKIRDQQPDAKFVIIGANPVSRVKLLEKYEGVSVTGTVSDIRPFLGCSVAMVAPLRIARGIQNKILESMAMGVPVVTSGKCIEALSPAVARTAIRADSEAEVINACLTIIRNYSERRSRSVLGRRAVRAEATWPANLRFLEKVIENLTEGAGKKAY
jgi:glycosyltransferase involved in cell wall biosynthesis